MNSYSVILEHKETQKIKILGVIECKDMDECITHIHTTEPDYWIDRISPCK